jgi:hypothetical protein
MYLHLGRDISVPQKNIIGIFDLDTTSYSKITREFLKNAESAHRVVNISDDIPKTFIVCVENNATTLYISQISSSTLLKRVYADPLPGNVINSRSL